MLPSWTMNSEDTFRQNLLMRCRRLQAILMTQHRPSAVCQSEPWERTVTPLLPPTSYPEPGRGPHKGRPQLLQREGSLSQLTPEAGEG